MNSVLTILAAVFLCSGTTVAADHIMQSRWAETDPNLDADPNSHFWRDAPSISMAEGTHGTPDPTHRTEIRSRWTSGNLYFLFICPYQQLHLKPHPDTSAETNELWNWDVAEAFIGSDFQHIRRYKEFEISPQGEWVDLDIDLDQPHHESGWSWNSGMTVSVKIDQSNHVWYGAMKIPYRAIDPRAAAAGNMLRINLFRSQGPPSALHQIAWQAPMSDSFHVPERFGLLKLVK